MSSRAKGRAPRFPAACPRHQLPPRSLQPRTEAQLRRTGPDAAGSSASAGGAGRRLQQSQPWFDTRKSIDQRVEALLNSMSLANMKAQMESSDAAAIPGLGVSSFKWQVSGREHGRVWEAGRVMQRGFPG